jgi:hypothetical protein
MAEQRDAADTTGMTDVEELVKRLSSELREVKLQLAESRAKLEVC